MISGISGSVVGTTVGATAPNNTATAALLAPLGISTSNAEARGGADNAPLVKAGTPVIDLRQDGTRYYDIHHTADARMFEDHHALNDQVFLQAQCC